MISTIEEFEELVDLPTVYLILDITAGLRLTQKKKKVSRNKLRTKRLPLGTTWIWLT